MATLVNKLNPEVKVSISNMREFKVYYSDNEGVVMFFKRDWGEVKEEELIKRNKLWKTIRRNMKRLWKEHEK